MSLLTLESSALAELAAKVREEYADLKAKGLKLDLTRGKPSKAQLDLSNALLSLPGEGNYTDSEGADLRNYGNLKGVKKLRELWGELTNIDPELLLAGDSSSLNIMFDLISWAYTFGTNDSPRPWSEEETVKWICPVPGYDRHFAITELFGFELVTVSMEDDGPDVEAIAKLAQDPQVKGMWLIPMFSNPTGVLISEEKTRRLAEMDTAAPDFRIVWDNAYAVHTLTDEFPEVLPVLDIAKQGGHPNRFWAMSSSSKVTFAGSGVSFFGSSAENLDWYLEHAGIRGIGPNKINQFAHAEFFGSADGVRELMRRHAELLAPKFAAARRILDERLGEYGVAEWTDPEGGYFISMDVVDGTATRVWELAKDAGIVLTKAGAAYPHGRDENDRNIRLAVSLPPQEEIEEAIDGVATCVLLAAIEKAEG
ncbi:MULTISPECIES: aminotransferase class I/II-fold pyridoxal phosphate-dependent enzyme [unclassified Corynebacterium]|uniref:aminotransferase class I/II-fold pyridoxal phosphate-dependent enzyme n=1 Tax=unclassified Corynebacterium TaxID=2624378 RepID=UPI001EF743D2|nr:MULTISPECIES: aminotransferase class I/II-fold pyridoxal phosphate-dependent enzyme [unclassified Corynebacterium]MCG7242893.1 aminotransferase class I/II-fold pyridoxal phosphate-dependent enzyme [Corynebacterium sp. ACRPS]MCG7272669.1 aminotransferase class I/II-fold pyridoxal phosphate-dependent enzyme [Corynebacterium sp. ACRQM]MCG7233145.1 aminotransferase class I/II-fold pyridoxal phosphate-dependent enzyme [Corynebacterium sp. ACRPR]MDK8474731.1 aminotransferase class I/II-fold pyrido